jgi:hypothetical protein
VGTATALTITYNFANDIFVFTTGSGTATASYGFNTTIKAGNNIVFNSSNAETNPTLTAAPGGEIIRSGTQGVTTRPRHSGQSRSYGGRSSKARRSARSSRTLNRLG